MLVKKIKIIFFLFIVCGFNGNLFSQVNFADEIVAEVDGEKITASLFQELWEMSPHLNAGSKNNSLSERINFLNTIVAYKLWNRNKDKYRVDTSAAYSTAVNEIEKMFVRDALYKKEITNKITITPEELNTALKKQERTLIVDYLLSPGEEGIKNYYKLLNSGYPFDSLIAVKNELTTRKEPIKIKFGDYTDPAEEELFSLKPGTFTQPIQFSDGYYIFYLRDEIKKVWSGVEEQAKEIQKAEDIIKKRKENVLYDSFMKKTLDGVKADVNRKLFEKLESGLVYAFKGKKSEKDNNSFITLSVDEYAKMENTFLIDELESGFISFADDTIKLGKCLRALYFNGLRMPSGDPVVIEKAFDTYIRNFIQMEVLYKEGLKNGLQYSPEVQKYLKMWSEYYSFETIKGGMLDTVEVTPAQIRKTYNSIYKDITENTFMRFDYICLQDSTRANDLSRAIKNGIVFDSLKTLSGQKIEGAFFSDNKKWISVSECGDYKTQLLKLEAGDSLEPFNYDSLFVVLKIIDKKKSKEMLGYASYEESYPQLKKQLAWEKLKNQITKRTADYAVSSDVKINYEALKKIDLTRISSMTIRFLGFGGQISGVPVYTPNYEWTDLLDVKTLLP